MSESATQPTEPNRRHHGRTTSLYSGSLHHDGLRANDCVVRDISAGGARVLLQRLPPGQQHCVLDIDGLGLFPCRIVWRRGNEAGVKFLTDPEAARLQIDAAAGRVGRAR
ncbi:MAG: PilZ protein [Rhodospirillales bacterium]|jgi:hypothetical protein|nr:PilZ protein [Rhodospirillales bacterium]